MLRTFLSALVVTAAFAAHPLAQADAGHKPSAPAAKPSAMVNINTASAAELEQLPGIGAKTAARILDYRQTKGPFKKIEELMNVRGVGEKNFLKLKPQIAIAAKAEGAAGK